MYRIDYCPACASQDIKKELAQLSQFVAWMATDEFHHHNPQTYAVVCNDCSYIGSGLRLTPAEEDKFYRNYRGEDYTNKRIFCEPWYKNYLETFDKNGYLEERRLRINNLIDKHVNHLNINTVLDYWGGSGEHIPIRFIKAKRYVSNIVPTTPLPNILNFDLSAHFTPFDFIMCCGIFEHQSDPDLLMNIVKKFMNQDTWLYIEVPFSENPSYDVFHETLNLWNFKSLEKFLDRFQLKIVDYSITNTISLLARSK